MDYFVMIRSGAGRVGSAIIPDVVKVRGHQGFVAFYQTGNVIVVPHDWLMDYGPIEDGVARPEPVGADPEKACRILDNIIRRLDPRWKGGESFERSISQRDCVCSDDGGIQFAPGDWPGSNDAG